MDISLWSLLPSIAFSLIFYIQHSFLSLNVHHNVSKQGNYWFFSLEMDSVMHCKADVLEVNMCILIHMGKFEFYFCAVLVL